MKSILYITGCAVAIASVALGALWFAGGLPTAAHPQLLLGSVGVGEPYVTPPFAGVPYQNDEFGFRIGLPEGFRVSQVPADARGGRAILLQDEAGNGIQIYITPALQDIPHLSAADVQAAIPDMHVFDAQTVAVGENRTGVAFRSDNEAFGGSSREVWFFFRGNLYQISTYARLEDLLQDMFGTWEFF